MSLDVRLTGTKAEIGYTLALFKAQGYEWESNGGYYPQRSGINKVAYYLNNVTAPPIIPAATAPSPDEPQPGPYNAVLGGKGRSTSKSVES
ncbi:MAG: hypothetical protein MUE44_27595 [Oscillatoriaceae cyanobacterium Prado104]|jgi:hypothetical protein|nr:hypothetical protein [Oscillatoriaceae cyanobacterium Prado104]